MHRAKSILHRIKEMHNLGSDRELAILLEMPLATLRGWYQRETMDWDAVLDRVGEVDLNWLVNGRSISVDRIGNALNDPNITYSADCKQEIARLNGQIDALKFVIKEFKGLTKVDKSLSDTSDIVR